MCGIAGVFGARRPEVVERMLATIVHRGPDDGHVVAMEGFTLGARRLSIIDLEGGRQPLSNESGDVWVAQNGEIYNFPDLARRLAASGHAFATRCDTEVIAHQYEESGAETPTVLHGMFALAVYDRRSGRGLLARDRTGKKPLYYWEGKDLLYFASEIKALLAVPEFEREIDWEAIHHFLGFKHVPAPFTAFRGIKMLPPAHRLIWGDGRIARVERYWRPSYEPFDDDVSEAELVDTFLDRLREGVRRRLISDVPIGFFLSGGLDSSLSTCLAAELNDEPIRTFTLTYSEESATEGKRLDVACARRVASQYGTVHHEECLDYSRFPEEFPRIIRHFDEPFGGVVSTYFLARLISRHVKVTLSGDGADELFGSYLSHRLALPLDEYRRGVRTSPDFEGRAGFLGRLQSDHDWDWRARLLVFSDDDKATLYGPDLRKTTAGFSTRNLLREVFSDLTARDPLNRILEAEFLTFFPDQVLTFVDRLSMAHSLEVRTAFLDTDVVEFVARLPARYKIRDGVTKYLLKEAARRYLPADIIDRPKEGFVMPINQWLMTHLREYALDLLSPTRLRAQGYFDPEGVRAVTDAFYGGDGSLANRILNLLAFQVWHDECFKAPAAAALC
jgi:asparagine synthase (glutamine-hydrolysing)